MARARAVIGSVTSAMRARSVLEREVIRVDVVKITDTGDRRGCVYGIEFSDTQTENVLRILNRSRITVKRLIR
ncbi:MAG: hypothetical protein IKA82_03450 [Clostridia bacterium]|nr:hypothetical protein [Clostridia bacterium]